MEKKNIEHVKSRRIASIASVIMLILITAAFVFESLLADVNIHSIYVLVMIAAFVLIILIISNTVNRYKLAFNVPFFILMYYMILMWMSNWQFSHYLLVCFALCAISCVYSSFVRTVVFILVQNAIVAYLIARGTPINGHETHAFTTLVSWVICLFGSILMLLLTRLATVVLNKAIENQTSFRDLLDSTENYVAMIDSRNEIVYASRTLSRLGNVDKAELVQGRPLIDLFPGKSLKVQAGKLLKRKDDYADDWEFTLDGQKRYFKAVSHELQGASEGTLISLYDMTHLAERDEIAAMKDSMKIGLFFMDGNFIIQDHYSRYLEEMLSDTRLFGKNFVDDVIVDSVTPSEMTAIKDYFKMVIEKTYDQEMLEDINPLSELHYTNSRTGERKVFQCEFNTVEKGQGEYFILVTVYDITVRVELQQRLAEEESRRQEEMQSVFELIQVQPDVFNDFMGDMEHEFDTIDKTFKNDELSTHEALVKVYQSIHAVKSNAVILGLNIFGNKVHNLESKIKKLREVEGNIPFAEMLNLTMDIEKLSQEREGFREVINKLKSYTRGSGSNSDKNDGDKQNVRVLVESLAKTAARGAEDLEKQIKFIANDVDAEAILKGPRRVMKEILMQLVRNSVVHGIETPDERKAKGKNETGIIKLSITTTEDRKYIHIRLSDDGKGIDYQRIADRALKNNLIKSEDAENKDMLIKAIFLPGFSTAETEGVHGGRGIGLNLVRDRIKEVNGNIKLKSEAGKGTMFFVSIPVVTA